MSGLLGKIGQAADKIQETTHRGLRIAFDINTEKLVQIRAGKVSMYLNVLRGEIDRLAKREGLFHDTLEQQYRDLYSDSNLANAKVLSDQRNAALEPIKDAAEKAAADASATVSNFLKKWDIVDDQRMKARVFVKLANEESTRKKKDGGPDLSYLIQPGQDIAVALDALEVGKTVDCEKAVKAWQPAFEKLRPVMNEYREKVLAPPLQKAVNEARAAAPDGPEALMFEMFPKLSEMMTNMKLTALATGADISTLNPALAAAVAEYTTSSYTDINEILLGLGRERDDARKAACKALTKVVVESMEKLTNFDGWPTNRGEKPWPGSDAQYKKGNTFHIKAFWSTGVGFKFDGSIQITIDGATKSKGKDVSPFSRFPNEREVLFPPGTRFEVVKNETKQGVSAIKLKEV